MDKDFTEKKLYKQNGWSRLFHRLLEIDRIRTSEQSPKLTNTFELVVIKEGKGKIMIEQEEFLAHNQDIFVIHPAEVYSIACDKQTPCEYLQYRFEVFSYPTNDSIQSYPLKGKIVVAQIEGILKLAEDIFLMKDHQSGLEQFHRRGLFEQLIYQIEQNKEVATERDTFTAIEHTRLYIESQLHRPLSIKTLAAMARISPKYYSSLFKKEYGVSVSEYITTLRVNKAKRLLIKGTETLYEIAKQVGYKDEFYLSRKFKQIVGIAPSIYRLKRKKKIAAYDLSTTGYLLALNIIPFAAPIHPKWTNYYYRKYRDEIPVHLSAFKINQDWRANIAKLFSDRPDMIVTKDTISVEEKRLLEQIAPVYYYASEKNWRKQLHTIAQFLGEEREAEEWLYDYDQQVQYVKRSLAPHVQTKSFIVLRLYHHTLFIDRSKTIEEVLSGDLNINHGNKFNGLLHNQVITIQELAQMNPDYVLLNICQEAVTLRNWDMIKNSSAWNSLSFVQQNHFIMISSDPWREYSAFAHERIIREFPLQLLDHCPTIKQEIVHVQ
ncbi:AraC family transcriptional regulator [Heyndrickxia ginsengihumi]|uniref:AraC family transcriptional regulator n=1 Tax=Heyndrickxia ginsengihumi TaxID=363870 RepID=A0A0A6VCQ8_9BACI|nr:AraC family transcriptional regulator [Heyndrickxia ginsengihumi]KHD85356.1 hypothetical protein NG54_09630 [Heyndrickxia ginsengihumi]